MEPDRLAAALALLSTDELTRLTRSQDWRANRYRQRGRYRLADWHEVLGAIVEGERLARTGLACNTSPLRELRQVTFDLPERDRFLLASEYTAALFDVEAHALHSPMRLTAVIADELSNALIGDRSTPPIGATQAH